LLLRNLGEIKVIQLLKSENEEKRDNFIETFERLNSDFNSPILDKAKIDTGIEILEELYDEKAPKTSLLTKIYNETMSFLESEQGNVEQPTAEELKESRQYILKHMPYFVYYSNYGNLDSEIYLPHVIENLERTDLGTKETAKVKTLKVLFDYVKLEPQDILDLGRTDSDADLELSNEEIEAKAAEKKSVVFYYNQLQQS
jgi:hypothetical protein